MQSRRRAADWLLLAIATGFGAGYSPVVPGTIGALWGLALTWGLLQVPSFAVQAGLLALLAAGSVAICARAGRLLGQKDPSAAVIDEIVSMPLVFALLPREDLRCPVVWASGFLLHRAFDIAKPPPLAQLERLPGGLGIMSDDLMAGVYANLVLRLALAGGLLAHVGC